MDDKDEQLVFEKRDHHARSREDRDAHDRGEESSREEVEGGDEQEGRSRRRRRRGGRGRKQRDDVESNNGDQSNDDLLGRAVRDEDDDEHAQDDAPTIRHAKIPSWTETISVLVEANMLNHQRTQNSPRGNPRGRGRR